MKNYFRRARAHNFHNFVCIIKGLVWCSMRVCDQSCREDTKLNKNCLTTKLSYIQSVPSNVICQGLISQQSAQNTDFPSFYHILRQPCIAIYVNQSWLV